MGRVWLKIAKTFLVWHFEKRRSERRSLEDQKTEFWCLDDRPGNDVRSRTMLAFARHGARPDRVTSESLSREVCISWRVNRASTNQIDGISQEDHGKPDSSLVLARLDALISGTTEMKSTA